MSFQQGILTPKSPVSNSH